MKGRPRPPLCVRRILDPPDQASQLDFEALLPYVEMSPKRANRMTCMIAFFSDIHGNLHAVEAVSEAIERSGLPDEFATLLRTGGVADELQFSQSTRS